MLLCPQTPLLLNLTPLQKALPQGDVISKHYLSTQPEAAAPVSTCSTHTSTSSSHSLLSSPPCPQSPSAAAILGDHGRTLPGGQESSRGSPRHHLADIAAAVGVEVVEEDPLAPSDSESRFHGRSSSRRRGPLLRAGGGCAEPGGAGRCRIALTAGAGRCGHGLRDRTPASCPPAGSCWPGSFSRRLPMGSFGVA